jgi:Tol biopolymer transport system component
MRLRRLRPFPPQIVCPLALAVVLIGCPVAAAYERIAISRFTLPEDDSLDDVSRGATAAISADGRFVAFSSGASDIVSGDTNGRADVFVRDRVTGTTELVSRPSGGGQADGASFLPAISADGRLVAFISDASNLVPGSSRGRGVFVHERVTGSTEKVSNDSGRVTSEPPAVSADGRIVAFSAVVRPIGFADDVLVRDRRTGELEAVSVAPDGSLGASSSFAPAISGDGQVIAFNSFAWNLVPGGGGVLMRDRTRGATERVGASAPGGPAVSADGRFVAFFSHSREAPGDSVAGSNIYLRDRVTGVTELVSVAADLAPAGGSCYWPDVSADGRFVAFRCETDDGSDVFVRDRAAGTTELVSDLTDGWADNPAISADGRFVLFESSRHVGSDDETGDDIYTSDLLVYDRVGPPPAPSTPDLAAESDTGHSDTDDRTSDPTPTFTGTAQTGTTVRILVDGAERGSATADQGAYSITTDSLPDGRHFITATATDTFGATSEPSGALELGVDTAAPELTVPEAISVDAARPEGALVTFAAWAEDAVDGILTPRCNPPSGRMLPIGMTTVSCVAADAAGNIAAGSFRVVVLGAAEQIDRLIDGVSALPGMAHGITASIVAKLAAAQRVPGDGCKPLQALWRELQALADHQLTAEQAAGLSASVRRIRSVSGCSTTP